MGAQVGGDDGGGGAQNITREGGWERAGGLGGRRGRKSDKGRGRSGGGTARALIGSRID